MFIRTHLIRSLPFVHHEILFLETGSGECRPTVVPEPTSAQSEQSETHLEVRSISAGFSFVWRLIQTLYYSPEVPEYVCPHQRCTHTTTNITEAQRHLDWCQFDPVDTIAEIDCHMSDYDAQEEAECKRKALKVRKLRKAHLPVPELDYETIVIYGPDHPSPPMQPNVIVLPYEYMDPADPQLAYYGPAIPAAPVAGPSNAGPHRLVPAALDITAPGSPFGGPLSDLSEDEDDAHASHPPAPPRRTKRDKGKGRAVDVRKTTKKSRKASHAHGPTAQPRGSLSPPGTNRQFVDVRRARRATPVARPQAQAGPAVEITGTFSEDWNDLQAQLVPAPSANHLAGSHLAAGYMYGYPGFDGAPEVAPPLAPPPEDFDYSTFDPALFAGPVGGNGLDIPHGIPPSFQGFDQMPFNLGMDMHLNADAASNLTGAGVIWEGGLNADAPGGGATASELDNSWDFLPELDRLLSEDAASKNHFA